MRATIGNFLCALVLVTGTSIAATGTSSASAQGMEASATAPERIYTVMVNLPLSDRKAVFQGLSSAMKAAVWRVHFRKFSSENVLTSAQKGIIEAAIGFFSEDLYAVSKTDPGWESQVHEPLQRLEQSARNVFPPDQLLSAFGQLGHSADAREVTAASLSNTPVLPSGLRPTQLLVSECTCSEASDWCFRFVRRWHLLEI
ncbi:MAG: bacteriocin fulvocin C-related protein [Thermoanaerobaculia bacterium]